MGHAGMGGPDCSRRRASRVSAQTALISGMASLIELKAVFLKYIDDHNHRHVRKLAAADGIFFLCPACFKKNGGVIGTHGIICWFVGHVPSSATPLPGRWIPSGTGLKDLSFVGPQAASVLLEGGCNWHGFVTNGNAD